MKFRSAALIIFFLGLLTYAYFATTWFKPKKMGISFRQMGGQGTVFLLDQSYRLNEISVMKVSEAKNPRPHLMWHMIGTTNIPPVTDFAYGKPIEGMQYFANDKTVDPLLPQERYELVVRSGKLTGTKVFFLEVKTNSAAR